METETKTPTKAKTKAKAPKAKAKAKAKTKAKAPKFFREFTIGEKLFIRAVTYHYVGEVVNETPLFILLKDCSWVAESGRFGECLEKGTISESEPMIQDFVRVAKAAIVDTARWKHSLPRVAQ